MGPIPSGPSFPAKSHFGQPGPWPVATDPLLQPKGTQVKETYVCQSCGMTGGFHFESCDSKKPPPESLRYPIDILEKWAVVMSNEWAKVEKEMTRFSLSPPRGLKISDCAIIDNNGFWITAKNAKMGIREAVSSILFDTDLLPNIRRLTIEALTTCRQKIEDKKAADLKAKQEKETKLSNLQKMIDEFGADIIQFAPDQKKQDVSF